jgi:hypothetical protein
LPDGSNELVVLTKELELDFTEAREVYADDQGAAA